MGAHCVTCRQGRNPESLRRHGGEQRHPEFPGQLHRARRIAQASVDPPAVCVHLSPRNRHEGDGRQAAGILSQPVTFSGQLLGPRPVPGPALVLSQRPEHERQPRLNALLHRQGVLLLIEEPGTVEIVGPVQDVTDRDVRAKFHTQPG